MQVFNNAIRYKDSEKEKKTTFLFLHCKTIQ